MSSALGAASSALAEPEADVLRSEGNGRRRPPRPSFDFSSDSRLARRAAGGDPAAFEEIFRRYQQDLYRFCVGILREPQDAQDAVQNTMIRAMRALPGETREMQLKPWLYRVAHNEAVELRRRERPVEPLSPTVDDAGAGTEERVERDARLQTLLADIADLPERQRASLVMRELNGLGFGEIGAALGTSPGAVRQALYEARRGLGQMEAGRDMDCDVAMKQVSDTDGSPSRRGIRAHLRGCLKCRRFQAEIRERRETLAAISPMPAIAAAALLKGGLGGSAGAATGAGGGSAAAVGGSSAAAGGAGALGVSGLIKATAGLIAALAVGTVAVDHGGILGHGQDSGRLDNAPAQVRAVDAAQARPVAARHQYAAGRRAGGEGGVSGGRSTPGTDQEGLGVAAGRGTRPASAGAKPLLDTSPGAGTAGLPTGTGEDQRSTGATEVAPTRGNSDSPVVVGTGEDEGSERSHPEHPAQSQKSVAAEVKEQEKAEAKTEKAEAKAVRTEEKAQAKTEKSEAKAERAEAKEDPARPERGNSAASTSGAVRTASEPPVTPSESSAAQERPEHPEHPAHREGNPDESVAPEVTETTTEAVAP